MGRLGSDRPERARRTAFATARMASGWPTTRWPRRSSIWTSFWTSPSRRRVTGMPVHLATTSATSSSSTSSFRRRPWPCCSARRAFAASSSCWSWWSVPKRSSAARFRSPRRSASAIAVRAASISLRDLADLPDGVLLDLPARLERRRPLLQVAELPVEALEALPGRLVALLREGDALDLELHDAPLDLVELGRHGVDLDPEPRGGLVDQVDRLVGEEPVGDVAVREDAGRHQRRVLDPDLVVDLVLLLEAAEDRDGVLDGGLLDEDGLEAALERGVLLHVLPVLVERGRADAAELPARQRRLQHVRGVHRALGAAGADQRVELVDEADDLPAGLADLAEHGLQPILELAAVLGPGDEGAKVQRDQALALETLGHVAGHDALRQPLHDGGLADAGLTDQDRVVLGPAREHLHDAADLVVAPDDRIELALPGKLGQVAAVALERLVLGLGVLVRHPLGAAHVDEGPVEPVLRHPRLAEDAPRGALGFLGDRDQEVLGGAVVVLQPLHLVPGRVERRP